MHSSTTQKEKLDRFYRSMPLTINNSEGKTRSILQIYATDKRHTQHVYRGKPCRNAPLAIHWKPHMHGIPATFSRIPGFDMESTSRHVLWRDKEQGHMRIPLETI